MINRKASLLYAGDVGDTGPELYTKSGPTQIMHLKIPSRPPRTLSGSYSLECFIHRVNNWLAKRARPLIVALNLDTVY